MFTHIHNLADDSLLWSTPCFSHFIPNNSSNAFVLPGISFLCQQTLSASHHPTSKVLFSLILGSLIQPILILFSTWSSFLTWSAAPPFFIYTHVHSPSFPSLCLKKSIHISSYFLSFFLSSVHNSPPASIITVLPLWVLLCGSISYLYCSVL